MDNFQKIQSIKEAFDDKLYQTDDFKITKGLLYDFGAYLEKNKGILYGLLGAAVFNIAANAMPHNIGQVVQEPVVMEQMINSTAQDKDVVNKDGMDMYAKIESFKANVQMGNSIQNHIYIGQEIHKINAESIKELSKEPLGTVKIFENPFWKGNFVEVNVTEDLSNKFFFPQTYEFKATHENAMLLVDNSPQKMYFNQADSEDFAHYGNIANKELMTKYIVYHEMAHGAFRQANRLGGTTDVLKGEVHSDITSLTMIGVESKSLQEFNEAADMLMTVRVKSLKDRDFGHNDSYAIGELKKVINDNPDLLKMKVDDVSEFAYLLTDTLFKENFKHNHEALLDKMGITLDKKSIFNDIKAQRNLDLYDSVLIKLTGKYMFSSKTLAEEGMDSRIENFSKRVEREMKDHMQFDAVSTLMFRDNGGDVAKTTKDIHDSVAKNPVISKAIIDPIKQKVHIDGLEYDLSKVNDIRLNHIAKEAQTYVSKHNLKI